MRRALVAFEGKLALSNAVISAMLRGQDELQKEWCALHNRLGEKNKNRNKLAHGQVVRIRESGVVQKVCFVPYHIANLIKELPPAESTRLHDPGQPPYSFPLTPPVHLEIHVFPTESTKL